MIGFQPTQIFSLISCHNFVFLLILIDQSKHLLLIKGPLKHLSDGQLLRVLTNSNRIISIQYLCRYLQTFDTLIILKAKAFYSKLNENGAMEIYIFFFIDGQMLKVWTLTLLWKLADSAFSEMLDSDKPTCSKTLILL